jgi:hypothetical protein
MNDCQKGTLDPSQQRKYGVKYYHKTQTKAHQGASDMNWDMDNEAASMATLAQLKVQRSACEGMIEYYDEIMTRTKELRDCVSAAVRPTTMKYLDDEYKRAEKCHETCEELWGVADAEIVRRDTECAQKLSADVSTLYRAATICHERNYPALGYFMWLVSEGKYGTEDEQRLAIEASKIDPFWGE